MGIPTEARYEYRGTEVFSKALIYSNRFKTATFPAEKPRLIPIRNLKVSKDKSNFENYLVMPTEARYEYRGTETFSNKLKRALPRSGCALVMSAACRMSSVATPVAPASSGPPRQRRNSQSLLALRLRFGINRGYSAFHLSLK